MHILYFYFILYNLLLVSINGININSAFQTFKVKFMKSYASPLEENLRRSIFAKELVEINEFNSKNESYKQGVNQFSDLTHEEKKAYTLRNFSPEGFKSLNFTTPETLREEEDDVEIQSRQSRQYAPFDWQQKGAVSDVKNQGGCGSCWAFSVVGSLEGVHWVRHRQMIVLSEQELVDCHKRSCDGEWPGNALDYVRDNGLNKDDCYRYESGDGRSRACRRTDNCRGIGKIKGYSRVSDEDDLRRRLKAFGPMCWTDGLSRYSNGIYDEPVCNDDSKCGWHAVTLTGYGEENGKRFWRLKNSWGKGYGEDGYFRMVRGVNRCFVHSFALYPNL